MKTQRIITALVAGTLIAVPAIAAAQNHGNGNRGGSDAQERAQVERDFQRDMDRDRFQDRDRITDPARDRDRIQDRTHAPDDARQAQERVYGYELMTDEERLAYRERLQNAANEQEREQVMAQHRQEIQDRARNRNIQIDETGNPVGED